jgi:predicted Fe-Mo cluster-binding NifX family protein
MKIAIPINRPRDKNDLRVSSHFAKAYAFAIYDTETKEINVVDNPRNALKLQYGAGRLIADMFTEKGVNVLLTKEIGAGAFGHVTSLGIKIYLVPENVKEVKEAIKLYEEGKLEPLLEPNEESHKH